jgi:hypothetical protein
MTLSFLESTYTDPNFVCHYKVKPNFSNDEFGKTHLLF